MIDLEPLRAIGVAMAVLATVGSLGTEGFYAWKVYEYENVCSSFNNESDVCMYEELQVRSYVGLVEGIIGSCVSLCLIIGFIVLNLPLIWIWVCWGLGITGYNAYCIYDYYTQIDDNLAPDDIFMDQPYADFFIMVLSSVFCYTFVLLIVIPVGAAITHMVGPASDIIGSYELHER